MIIHLAADHAGFELKEKIKSWLKKNGYEVKDFGAFEFDPADDYPDFMNPAAQEIAKDPENNRGIFLGGSGEAEAMVANRHKGVRATVFYCPCTPTGPADVTGRKSKDPLEIIRLSREHNNANVLCLAARFLKEKEALKAVELWLKTPFPPEERHQRRIDKIDRTVL